MPKLVDRAPKLRRHATGQVVVTLGGRDYYCGRFGTRECRERYRRFVQEWFASGCTLPPGQPAREHLLVKQVIAGYWQHAKTYYRHADGSPTSTLWILKSVLRTLRRFYGNLPAAEFGPLRLNALRDEWVRAGNCRTTCNAYVGHVVRCFRWAVANELMSGEIYQALRALDGLRAGRSNAVEGKGVGTVHPWAVPKGASACLPYRSRHDPVPVANRLPTTRGVRTSIRPNRARQTGLGLSASGLTRPFITATSG